MGSDVFTKLPLLQIIHGICIVSKNLCLVIIYLSYIYMVEVRLSLLQKFTQKIRHASITQFPFISMSIDCHFIGAYVILLLLLHFIMYIPWLLISFKIIQMLLFLLHGYRYTMFRYISYLVFYFSYVLHR